MKLLKGFFSAGLVLGLAMILSITAYAADYSIKTGDDADYYNPTSYEDVYGTQYNYGGPNAADYDVPDLAYGNSSSTQHGIMERVKLPGDFADDAGGSGVFAPSGGGYGLGDAEYGGKDALIPEIIPDYLSVQQSAFTSVAGMAYSNGSIGTVKIPSLGYTLPVWEGETTQNMSKGLGHYSSTSAWNGNVGMCGHNRGQAKYVIGSIKDLKKGDIITYTTVYGTRTYRVETVQIISDTDWSYLQPTADNRLTLTTCLANYPEVRVCVQAVEAAN